jgi:hypothetical protein
MTQDKEFIILSKLINKELIWNLYYSSIMYVNLINFVSICPKLYLLLVTFARLIWSLAHSHVNVVDDVVLGHRRVDVVDDVVLGHRRVDVVDDVVLGRSHV